MSYDKIIKTMKVGFMAPFYPVPAGVEDRVAWAFARAHEMGCTTLDGIFGMEDTGRYIDYLKGLMDKYNIEPDIRTGRKLFDLTGPDGKAARDELILRCKTMHKLGLNILRSAYNGMLKLNFSRYDKQVGRAGHMKRCIENLREAAKILEDEEIFLGIENHMDFTGRDFVEIFDAVDSPCVGAALDTGNGMTVFSDPNEEYKLLAPYVITTHIKDTNVLQDPAKAHAPYAPVDCMIGEGFVDIEDAIETMARKSKHAVGLHLIVETGAGYFPYADLSDVERDALQKKFYDAYVERLLQIVNR